MESSMEAAIVDWLNTFGLGEAGACQSVWDLKDGVVLLRVLHEISPSHFELSALSSSEGNWALSASNVKKLLRLVDEYYRAVLGKRVGEIDAIDAALIARDNDAEEMLSLVELVVGVAVMCPDKARFIQNIFALDAASQSALKGLVERVMQRTEDIASAAGGADDGEEESIRLQEMVRHLQAERARLSDQVGELERANDALTATTHALRSQVQQHESDREALEGSDRTRHAAVAARAEALQMQLQDTQRDLDLATVQNDTLRADLRASQARAEGLQQAQARLEFDSRQLADELDVARDRSNKLSKAEAQLDKYTRRLEELAAVKRENKELADKLDQYIEKMHELESSNKNIATMNKLVEQYRDKAVDMEREKFQAVSALQMQQHDVERMARELDEAADAKRFLEEELAAARAELVEHLAVAAEAQAETSSPRVGAFEPESAASLRERLKLLELELKESRHAAAGEQGSEADSPLGQGGGGAGGAASAKELATALAVAQSALELEQGARREREELLLAARKHASELQLELQRSQRALAEQERAALAAAASAALLRESEQRLALSENTLRLLESNLRDKESLVSRLEQDKSKLETFSKSTLLAFKDKYMKALKAISEEKRTLEERLAVVTESSERNAVTSRREERLMLSAFYEIGVKIMDANIAARHGPLSPSPLYPAGPPDATPAKLNEGDGTT